MAIWKTGAIRDAMVINGFMDAGINCEPYPESNPDYVLSRASLIFGSGYVDCTSVVGRDLASHHLEILRLQQFKIQNS